MKIKLISLSAILCFSFIAFIPNSYALSTDRDQPAEISSDEVDVDFNTGRRTFIGNVRFVQGTLRVKADRIDASYKDGKIIEATAYGKPAAFRQRPDGKEDDVEGRGNTIVMNQVENTLTLKKNASLKQGFDVARGSIIFYNMEDDTLKVRGNASGSQGKKDSSEPSKTETDPFFSEPTKEILDPKPIEQPVEKKPEDTSSNEATQEQAPTEDLEESLIPQNDEQPDEIILPGQADDEESEKESSGRSRLIIRPKS